MKYKIYNQDVVEWSKSYEKQKFHALLSDAPYELNFMGQKWDRSGVAFRPETWATLGEHLYPGAFGMCFSASRNWHRLAVAIEDAGFIIHPTIFLWAQGQGFPKATNISAQLDKRDGLIGHRGKAFRTAGAGDRKDIQGKNGIAGMTYTEPKSEMSTRWIGHRYGLQALKPAVEPIIVFQKPYEGRPLDNIVETGAGALNIDLTRIPLANGDEYTINEFTDGAKPFGNGAGHPYKSRKVKVLSNHSRSSKSAKSKGIYGDSSEQETHQTPGQLIGRWPANFILDESVAGRLDEQSGDRPTGEVHRRVGMGYHGSDVVQENIITNGGDSGGASRFFYNVSQQLDENDPVYYCGKVSPKERNAGLEELPLVERRPSGDDWGKQTMWNGENGDEEWKKKNPNNPVRNPHPTLKPIDLSRYLAKLLLPPEAYAPRRILIPFAGTMSEAIGAALAGWEHIVAIEMMKEYVEIGKKRMDYWISK